MNNRAAIRNNNQRRGSKWDGAVRYGAFISYNHRDRREAIRLHRALEAYRIPRRLRGRDSPLGTIGKRLPPIFRDRDELAAGADLAKVVRDALDESATLIVLCSPAGIASKWVDAEIRRFLEQGRRDRIICHVSENVPEGTAPLPKPLLEAASVEPLAADARPHGDGRRGARLKVIAAMLGLSYEELRKRDAARRQKQLALLAGGLSAVTLAMAALALAAVFARNEAVEQRDLARQRSITAERTVNFVKSMFEVSDPSQARGETITAREVLDRGAAKIDRELAREPNVRAELGLTLAEVYGSIGLFHRSDALLARSLRVRHDQANLTVRQLLAIGDARYRQGDYDPAAASYRRGEVLSRDPRNDDPALRTRALVGLGQSLTAAGDKKASAPLRLALALDTRRLGPDAAEVARDLEALALDRVGAGETVAARPLVERALSIRLRTEGKFGPSVGDNYNTLGSLAYMAGDLDAAERYYGANLKVDEAVLGTEHPDVAATLNNYARVLLDRRKFAAAGPFFERAMHINLAQRGEMHGDLAFIYANIGQVRLGLGDIAGAEAMIVRARTTAVASNHRLRGQIAADLGGLYCARNRVAEGVALLAIAGREVREVFGGDNWRLGWIDALRGECLVRTGHAVQGRQLIEAGTAQVLRKWPVSTLYGHYAAALRSKASRQSAS